MISRGDERSAGAYGNGRQTTKKARLLQLARTEPFLSVEEIAATVETTPRYVRTALSEAGLSLTKLRRQHAQTIRQRLSIGVRFPIDMGFEATSPGVCVGDGVQLTTRSVRVAQIIDAQIATWLNAAVTTPLLEISRVRVGDEGLFVVNRLITNQHLLVSDAVFTSDRSLAEFLGLRDVVQMHFTEQIVDIVRGDEYLCKSLQVAPDDPIIRCAGVLTVAGKAVAIKCNYFDGTRIRLVLGYAPDDAVHVVERDSGD